MSTSGFTVNPVPEITTWVPPGPDVGLIPVTVIVSVNVNVQSLSLEQAIVSRSLTFTLTTPLGTSVTVSPVHVSAFEIASSVGLGVCMTQMTRSKSDESTRQSEIPFSEAILATTIGSS